jgi:SAM-dependent methyltransferase
MKWRACKRALAQCHDMVVRRSAVLEALRLHSGERVMEVGCGGGFHAHEAAQCVGPTGRVCAVDLSADQIAAAKARCAELAWVECQVADAVKLPYGAAEFNALYGVASVRARREAGRSAPRDLPRAAPWWEVGHPRDKLELERKGAYCFSSTPIITEAIKVAQSNVMIEGQGSCRPATEPESDRPVRGCRLPSLDGEDLILDSRPCRTSQSSGPGRSRCSRAGR